MPTKDDQNSQDSSHKLDTSTATSTEKASKSSHKRLIQVVIGVFVGVVVILGAAGLWYSAQDHSIYHKLNTAHYARNGVSFSFKYPSVMKSDPSLVANESNAPIAYGYPRSGKSEISTAVSYDSVAPVLHEFNLTPDQFLAQIRTRSGSFVNAIVSQDGASAYDATYGGCTQTLVTTSSQFVLLCVSRTSGYVNTRIIGATDDYQYTLRLDMSPSLWSSHQKVWQAMEQSFSFK